MGKTRALRRSACGRPGERSRSCSPNLPEAMNWGSDAPAALSLRRRNAPALRVCVAKPWVPQPHCPKRQPGAPSARPRGAAGPAETRTTPARPVPKVRLEGAKPGRGTRRATSRVGAQENPHNAVRGRRLGRGLVPGGVRSAGPGCGGPGASVRPSARGGPACPGNPAPTGSVSSLPAPPSVLTLLPGGTRHPRNPGPAPQRPLPRI